MKIIPTGQGFGFLENISRDKRALAKEFEALMMKEILRTAFEPMLAGKSFESRLYYDSFLDAVSKKLAEGGGIGIARFLLEHLRDEKGR